MLPILSERDPGLDSREGMFSPNSVVLLGNGNAGPSSIPQIPWLRTIHEIYYAFSDVTDESWIRF